MTSDPPEPNDDGDDETPPRKGGRPSMGPRKGYLLRLPPALLDELRSWSSQEMRSLNSHLEYLLRDAVRRRKGKRDEGPDDG